MGSKLSFSWLTKPSAGSDLSATLAKFPVVLLLSLVISGALYSLAAEVLAGDLANISRKGTDGWEAAGWVACRAGELLFAWVWGLDGIDLAALTFVSHYPVYFLFHQFYRIRPTTVISSMLIDIAASTIPFSVMRPRLPAHAARPPPGSVADRFLINDVPLQMSLAGLGAALHGLLLFTSYRTWLPVHLAQGFYPLTDLSAAKEARLIPLVIALIPLGVALRVLLFTPAAATQGDARDRALPDFDPATATLAETFEYTFWSWSARSRELIKRAAVAGLLTFAYTFLQLRFTVRGVDTWGAAGWAGLWLSSNLATAAFFGWVGQFEQSDALEGMRWKTLEDTSGASD